MKFIFLILLSLPAMASSEGQFRIHEFLVMVDGDRDKKTQYIMVDGRQNFKDGSVKFFNPKVLIEDDDYKLTSSSASQLCDFLGKRLGDKEESRHLYATAAKLFPGPRFSEPLVRTSRTHWTLDWVICEDYD